MMQSTSGNASANNFIVLATDNGPHPPHRWGWATTQMMLREMFVVEDDAPAEARAEVFIFKDRLESTLTHYYSRAMFHTAQELKSFGATENTDTHCALAQEMIASENWCGIVREAAHGLRFHNQCASEDVTAYVRERLLKDLSTIINIEHRWHNERNKGV